MPKTACTAGLRYTLFFWHFMFSSAELPLPAALFFLIQRAMGTKTTT